jgi:hypothetical protein
LLVFNKYFYKKKKSKLYFGDRVAVLNDFVYRTGGSMQVAAEMDTDDKLPRKVKILKI